MTPSRLDVRRALSKLNRMNSSTASYDAILSAYRAITIGMQVRTLHTSGGELFYRIRISNTDKPSLVEHLLAPPVHLVTGFQRCNPPGVPMFYSASRRMGALLESRAASGDRVYLSEWIGAERLPVNVVFNTIEEHAVDGADSNAWSGPNDDLLIAHLDARFTRPIHPTFSDDYKFTAAIAQHMTIGFAPADDLSILNDGLVALKYPSVLSPQKYYNIAMHAGMASTRLKLLHVMELVVNKIGPDAVDAQLVDTCVDCEGGVLRWSGNSDLLPAPLGQTRSVPFLHDGVRWKRRLVERKGGDSDLLDMLSE